MPIIAAVGLEMPARCPLTGLTIRILRATGNASYHSAIRKVAEESASGSSHRSSSLFALWIREDVLMCGTFNRQPRPGMSLVQQLLDTRPFDLVEKMKRMGRRMTRQ